MITFSGEEAPEMLGIYSFNLGRYSYYNMGLKFFKSFSRRDYDVTSGEWVEKAAPSLINNYEFYDKTETITSTSERINLNEVFSYEFGADADDNTDTHNTWSQDDLSIIKHIGSFKYNGVNGDDSTPTDAVWETLRRVFSATARMPDVREMYHYDGKNYVPTGEYYREALDMSTEYMLKRLSIKNTVSKLSTE